MEVHCITALNVTNINVCLEPECIKCNNAELNITHKIYTCIAELFVTQI